MGICCCYNREINQEHTIKISNKIDRLTIEEPMRKLRSEEHNLIKIKEIWKVPGLTQNYSYYLNNPHFTYETINKKLTNNSRSFKLELIKKKNKPSKNRPKFLSNTSNMAIDTKETSNIQNKKNNLNNNNHNLIDINYINTTPNNYNNKYEIDDPFKLIKNIQIKEEEDETINQKDSNKEKGENIIITENNPHNISSNILIAKSIINEFQNPITDELKDSSNYCSNISRLQKIKVTDKEISVEEEFQIKEIFLKLYLFDVFPEDALTDLLSNLYLVHVCKYDILFEKGNINTSFYIILKGKLEQYDENDESKVIKIYKEWDYFGYSSLMNQVLHEEINNKLVALTDCDLFVLEGDKYLEIQNKIIDKRLNERFDFLNNIIFFKGLDPFQKHNVAEKMEIKKIKENIKIVSKGEKINCIYLIKKGKVGCYYNNKECKILGESTYIGIMSILMKESRNLDLFTKEECIFFTITEDNLKDALGDNYIDVMLMSIFKEYINSNCTFSDLINRSNIEKVFETFKLIKYEKNEKINGKNKNLKRIVLILEGNLANCSNMKIEYSTGSLLGEETLTNNVDIPSYLLAYPECFTFESNLEDFSDLLGEDFRASTIHFLQKVIKMKKNPFFNSISENRLKIIVNNIKKEKYFPNQKIIEEDKEGKNFYIIMKGIVLMSKNEKSLRQLEKDSCFGEDGLLSSNKKNSATVTAITNVSCYVIKKVDFFKLYEEENVKKFLEKEMSFKNVNIELSDLCIIRTIGQGKFGEVSLVHNNKFIYAIKAVSRKEPDRKKKAASYLVDERRIMLSLDHPFIVKMIKSFKNNYFVFFLMEYVNGSSLKDILHFNTFNKEDTKFYISSLLIVIDYIHKKRIVQRDIKPNNIMVDQNGYIKMIDFGISKVMQDYTNTIVGTPHYMAPEVLNGKGYTFSCDYWSIGICAFEIIYKKYPFGNEATDVMNIYNDIIYSNFKFPSENEIFEDINEFIGKILIKQVNKRLCSFSKISKLSFFNGFNWDDLIRFKIQPPFKPNGIDLDKINFDNYQKNYEDEIENNVDYNYSCRRRDKDGKWASEF